MFSLFSSIQSPKSLLASKLSASLATYFDVDPSTIESNLVTNTSITLRDARLKPRNVGGSLLVGAVESIEFSWKWGGSSDGSTSFVRDAVLSIRGARFRIIAKGTSTMNSDSNQSASATESTDGKQVSPGMLDKYLYQIFDHLTLNITDIEVAVETLGENMGRLVIELQSLQLLSLGRLTTGTASSIAMEDEPPLSQRFTLGSLSIYLQVNQGEGKLPVLDPFSYGTSVRRVSGRRFDGLYRGLEITGDVGDVVASTTSPQNDVNCMVVHAGRAQLAALSHIIGDLLEGSTDNSAMAVSTFTSITNEVETPSETSVPTDSPTTVRLPFPSITLILPNEAKIQMPHCELLYIMDGTTFRLTGMDGIQVNDHPSPFLDVSSHCAWSVDMLTSVFSIRSTPAASMIGVDDDQTATVVSVNWDEGQMKRLVQGFLFLEEESRAVVEKGMKVCTNDAVEADPSAWSIAIEGNIDLTVCGAQDDWIKASLCSLYVSALSSSSGMTLSDFRVAGMQFGPASFGNANVHLPLVALDQNEDCLVFDGSALASLESWSNAEQTQSFMSRVLDFGLSPTGDKSDLVSTLPFGINLSCLQLDVSSPNKTSVQFHGIHVDRSNNVTIACVIVDDPNGTTGQVTNVSLSMAPEIVVSVGVVEAFHLPGVLQLDHPINDGFAMTMMNGVVNLDINTARATVLAPRDTPGDPNDSTPQKKESIYLPYPINVHCNSVALSLPGKLVCSTTVCLSSLDVSLLANDETVNVETRTPLCFRLETSNSRWLEAQLEPMTAVLTPGLEVVDLYGGGLRIGPCSAGHFATLLPAFRYNTSLLAIEFDDGMGLSVESIEVLQATQALISDISTEFGHTFTVSQAGKSDCPKSGVSSLPFDSSIPSFNISLAGEKMISVQMGAIKVSRLCRVSIEKIRVHQADDGLDGTLFDVTFEMQPIPLLQIGQIGLLRLPGVLETSRAMTGFSARLVDGTLEIEVDLFDIVIKKPFKSEHPSSSRSNSTQVAFPYPIIVLRSNSISVKLEGEGSLPTLSCGALDVSISQAETGAMTLQTRCRTVCCLLGRDKSWLEANVDPFTAVAASDFSITDLVSSGILIGPCSLGHVCVMIPPSRFLSKRDEICLKKDVDVTVDCLNTLCSLQKFMCTLVDDCHEMFTNGTPENDSALTEPYTITQKTKIAASTLRVNIHEEGLVFSLSGLFVASVGSQVSCDHLSIEEANGATLTASGIVASTSSDMSAVIETIDTFCLPGVVTLATPTRGMTLVFSSNQGLRTSFQLLDLTLLEGKSSKQAENNSTLGFPIECEIDELSCRFSNDVTMVRGIQLNAKPYDFGFEESCVLGVHFGINFKRFQSKLATVDDAVVSGVYTEPSTIANLDANISSGTVSAGFSSMEWHNILRPSRCDQETQSWNLPSARISPFSAKVEYKGRIVSTSTDLQISEFKGRPDCTSDELLKHITNATLRQIPSFFGNASVLGSSGRDIGASTVGQIALGAGLTGSIGGLVVVDSFRGAVKCGKVARGASSNDSYQFGDVTRGILRGISETAKTGRVMRGGDGNIQPGDFASGASSALGEYAGENKQRLGSAGGSSLGMAVGAVALGPLGLVAGCVVGGLAGARAFRNSQKEDKSQCDDGSNAQASRTNGDEPKEDRHSIQATTSDSLGFHSESNFPSHDVVNLIDGSSSIEQDLLFSNSVLPVAHPYDPFQPIENNGNPFATAYVLPPQQSASSNPLPLFVPSSPILDVWEGVSVAPRQHEVPCPHDLRQSEDSGSLTSLSSYNQPTSISGYPTATLTEGAGSHIVVRSDASNISATDFGGWPELQSHGQHIQNSTFSTNNVATDGQAQLSLPTYTRAAPTIDNSAIVPSGQTQTQNQYRFGDITRSIVAKGKESNGRSPTDGYKFGDFTRGFFSK